MAFNYLAWKRGVDYSLRSEFDGVRRYIRSAKRGEVWPYAQVQYPDDFVNKKLRLTLLKGCTRLRSSLHLIPRRVLRRSPWLRKATCLGSADPSARYRSAMNVDRRSPLP